MAYARFSNGDVYVFMTMVKDGGAIAYRHVLMCCMCRLAEGNDRTFDRYSQMLTHLDDHAAAGHSIPVRCFGALKDEQKGHDRVDKAERAKKIEVSR